MYTEIEIDRQSSWTNWITKYSPSPLCQRGVEFEGWEVLRLCALIDGGFSKIAYIFVSRSGRG